MAQLNDTVITGNLAVSNCIYGSVTCATESTHACNSDKGKNGSNYCAFGSNAFNSTAFTTCTGTVTSIKFQCNGTDKCTVTSSGTINLGTNAWNSTAFTTCTGTVTSIQFNNGATCCCKITSSGTICLGANAWNSTAFTTCTGTVTVSNTTSQSDVPVALCTGASSIGKSNYECFTFNPSTGTLCASYFCGRAKCACYATTSSSWNGRSACNYTTWCVCYTGCNNGSLCIFCNKTTDRLLIATGYNGCCSYLQPVIIAPGGKGGTWYCMDCGTSCVRVILM